MESMSETLFFQSYSERKLILIPCENAGVHWHIYGQQDEGCFDPFLVFGSPLEMSPGASFMSGVCSVIFSTISVA